MCLAIPSKIVKIDKLLATVEVLGVNRDISLVLLPDEASIGDFVLVHAGFAIQVIESSYALENIALFKEADTLMNSQECRPGI